MGEHTVTIEFEDGFRSYTFTCNAGPKSLCHARYTCDCEAWYDHSIRNGVPAHRPDPFDEEVWHAGVFDADECSHKSWFDEAPEESLNGVVTVPVMPVWEGEFWTFDIPATVLTPTIPIPQIQMQAKIGENLENTPVDGDEREALALVRERDELEEMCDRLAYAIAPVEVIGEHSSANSPWHRALEYADTHEWKPRTPTPRGSESMSDDYTPGTEEVRAAFILGTLGYEPCSSLDSWAGEGFDRWLTAHDARIASEAAERALREFRAGLGRRFWFQDPYGHFDPATMSALQQQVEGMLDAEARQAKEGRGDVPL